MKQIDPVMARLRQLYCEVEKELTGQCSGCGECCCFEKMDHTLFATELEYNNCREIHDSPVELSPGRCPYQQENRCLAREGRPLGCRLYYCQKSRIDPNLLEQISVSAHQQLQSLHEQFRLPWRYRPFLEFFQNND